MMADPDGSSEDAENDGPQYSTPDPRFQTQVLLVALLEQACNRYCDDSDLCERLFKKMCSMLVTRQIIPAEFAHDSYAVFRDQWLTSLQTMMSKAAEECQQHHSESSDKNAALVPVHGAVSRSMSAPAGPPSRYQSEFIQIERLGSGAFGCVYKAKHKLDKQYFAVKKLYSRRVTPGLWTEIRREVELLASLRHQHVVAYNSSWVEFQPNTACGNALTDACEEQMDVAFLDELEDSDDEQLEIIFDNQASSINFSSSNLRSLDSSDMTSTTCPNCHKIRRQAVTDDVICSCSRLRRTSSNPDDAIEVDDVIRKRKSHELKRTLSYDPELVENRVAIRRDYSNVLLQGRITVCIQMQLCDRNLKQWLHTRNDKAALQGDVFSSIEPAENARIFHQTLMAVDYIHKQGIVHRDLKPGNIFLHGESNCVKIGDFGLARTLVDSEQQAGRSPLSPGLGTALYAAPEQKGAKYDHKCDMYSLGVILYELYHPFVTESERINVLSVLRDSHIVGTEVRRLYRDIVDCILSLTARNPDKRPSAGQLLGHKIFNKADNEKSKLKYENRRHKKKIRQLQKDLMKIRLNSSMKSENSDS